MVMIMASTVGIVAKKGESMLWVNGNDSPEGVGGIVSGPIADCPSLKFTALCLKSAYSRHDSRHEQ